MVVSVTDPRDGFIRHSGTIRAIEQPSDLVGLAVDVHCLSGAVAPALRQPSQSLSYCAAPPQLSALVPERIEKSVHDQ
jgi:hypothetical protein